MLLNDPGGGNVKRPDLRVLGIGQLLLGVTALLAPERGSDLFGMGGSRASGEALFAWRLFAARQVCLGVGGMVEPAVARRVNLVVQPLDLGIFVHAYRTGSVPRQVALMGMGAASFALATAAAS
jgi:hypothetical protein